MSQLSISTQDRSGGKCGFPAAVAAVMLLSTATGQQNPHDSGTDSTKSEQTKQTVYCTDGWFSRDKVYHFMAGFIGTTAISGTVRNSFETPRGKSAEIASVGMLSVGALKETYDSRQPSNHFCWKDLTADVIGIVVGGWLWLTVSGDEIERMCC